MNYEELEQLLIDLGPSTDFVNGMTQLQPGEWVIGCYEDEVEVYMEYDQDAALLTLHSPLGEVNEDKKLEIYTTLLGITGHSRELGGYRLGLHADGKSVIQQLDVSLQGLDLSEFRQRLEGFCERAKRGHHLMDSYSQTIEADAIRI